MAEFMKKVSVMTPEKPRQPGSDRAAKSHECGLTEVNAPGNRK